MKLIIFVLCVVFVANHVYTMTDKQMKATMKLVRNTCQGKTKTLNEQIDAQHSGDFSQGQCYILCLLNTYKLLTKDGIFDWEAGIKTIQMNAPPEVAETASKSLANCKDSLKTTGDLCVGAAEIAKCIYDDNPAKYFLP